MGGKVFSISSGKYEGRFVPLEKQKTISSRPGYIRATRTRRVSKRLRELKTSGVVPRIDPLSIFCRVSTASNQFPAGSPDPESNRNATSSRYRDP